MITKVAFGLLSLLLLVYMLWPGPQSIDDFAPLPNSLKSQDPGDTYQVPNVAGYFSDNYRDYVTRFFKEDFKIKNNLPIPPLKLNYPPEKAFTYIKDQTLSTYLEEYVYPLRGSLFVNGFEPVFEDGSSRFSGGAEFGVMVEGVRKQYKTKVVVRYYPAPVWSKVLVWLGINISVILLYRLIRGMKKDV